MDLFNLASVSSGGSAEGCWGFPISQVHVSLGGSVEGCCGFSIWQVCLWVDLLKEAGGSPLVKCVFGWIC